MNPEIKYYLSVFIKKLPLFLIVFVGLTFGALSAAILLPTVYEARALLLVEEAQIPEGLAQSTVSVGAAEQLEIFEKRLLTRDNLVDIAREYGVFDRSANLSPDEIVSEMREQTTMRSTSGRNRATVLEIIFEGRSAAIAANVANEYVTRILADSARLRTQTASDTLEFFEQEVDRLGLQLEVQSAKIVEFQNANAEALPSSQNFRLSRQSDLQSRLAGLQREQISLRDQKSRFLQLFEASAGLEDPATGRPIPRTPEERQLDDLKTQLSDLLAVYSENNPRVTVIKARIEALESSISSGEAAVISDTVTDEADLEDEEPSREMTILNVQIQEIDSLMEFNQEQIELIEAELAVLSEAIEKTPNNTVALEALEREYEIVQAQYNQAVSRLSAAATGERIEVLSKGQRISVIEQAVPPDEPASPNRPLIAGGGTFLAFALALGLVVLLEILNRSIRRPMDLTNAFGISPIASVPYIATSADRLKRRLWSLFILAVFAVGVPAAIYYVHLKIYPMDQLVDLVIERLREIGVLEAPDTANTPTPAQAAPSGGEIGAVTGPALPSTGN